MKILHIHTSLAGGGIEAMVCALINEMSTNNDVTLATIFAPKPTDLFEQKIDKRIKRISLGKTKNGFSISEVFKIYKLIANGGYDIVHIHGFFYYFALAVILLHSKTKFYYTIHSDAYMENTKWDKRFLWLKKLCFKKKFIHPITISPVSQGSFLNLYRSPSTLICNGIAKPLIDISKNPIEQYRIGPSTKVFIHAGRINKAKNQVVLCQVFDKIIKEGHDVILLIVGGNHDNKIMGQLKPYFSKRICYLGERGDVPTLFHFADAMCLPSIWEGLPITILEALSVGCIPICSPVGGIVNVVKNGYNGFLSEDSSADSFYKIIKFYLSQSNHNINTIRQNCIESFKPYDITIVAKKYINLYKELHS